jgi:hypothetical protein
MGYIAGVLGYILIGTSELSIQINIHWNPEYNILTVFIICIVKFYY